MVKKELVDAVVKKTGLKKIESERAVNAIIEIITNELTEGKEVIITGFGKFFVKDRPERIGRNPATGVEVTIPACKAPAFKAGKILKEALK